MPSGQDVRFIRRHGRIIPIKINREKASRNRGLGLMGAGAAVSAGAAGVSAGLVVNADKVARRSGKLLARVNKVFRTDSFKAFMSPASVNRALRVGLKARKNVVGKLVLSKAVFRGGVGLGTGLFAAGALRSISQKDRPGSEGVIGAAAGVGALTISNKIFRGIIKKKMKVSF